MAWEIVFTDAAVNDLRRGKITKAEFAAIKEALTRIAEHYDPRWDYACQPIAQTGREWTRLKITKPSHLRLAFSTSDDPPTITVQAVLRRTAKTYDLCELVWKKATA